MALSLIARLEDVDALMERVRMQIERCTPDDPELGAGLAGGDLSGTQTAIDKMAVVVEDLDVHLRDIARASARW
ncbi:hypothetical protein ACFWNN_45340 [Lentzea sp. NPDC058450]|uniref:hypothetical protein n=1 Tax=Lentzea sp. NPDC058450 TaxID=3346505 RepID=UPI00364E17F9